MNKKFALIMLLTALFFATSPLYAAEQAAKEPEPVKQVKTEREDPPEDPLFANDPVTTDPERSHYCGASRTQVPLDSAHN